MAKMKRVFNVRLRDNAKMLNLMEKLGELNVELEAESRLGTVRIVAHGTREDISEVELKIRELTASKN